MKIVRKIILCWQVDRVISTLLHKEVNSTSMNLYRMFATLERI